MRAGIRAVRALPRTVWLLGLVSLFNDAASDMVYPLVPLYLTAVLMAGPRTLGLIEGMVEAASSLLKLAAGVLADRTRHMRLWVIAGYAVSGLSRPLLSLARSGPGVFVVRLLDRVGKGVRSAPRDALLGAGVEQGSRGLAFGLHRALDNTGAVVGPLLAAVLLSAGLSLRQIFLASVLPAMVAVGLALAIDRNPVQAAVAPKPMRWTLAGLSPALRRYLLALALFTLGNASNMFLLLRAQDLGTSAERIMLMWALFSGTAALLSTPLSALSDRFGRVRVLGTAWSAYAVVYLVLGLLPGTGWALWLSFAIYGAVMAALEGTERALVADLVEPGQAGTAFGWYNLVSGLMLLPASWLFGSLWQTASPLLAFAFGAACAAAAALLLFRGVHGPEDDSHEER